MIRPALIRTALVLGPILIALPAASPTRGDYVFHVSVDASTIPAGTSGYLDFQFDPGGSAAQAATASVTDFRSTGLTLGGLDLSGQTAGSGPLPSGPIVLGNAFALNEALQAVSFASGASFSFDLTLGGPAVDAPSGLSTAGTEFSLGVLDSSYEPLLPISSPVDPLIAVDLSGATGAPSAASYAPLVASITPSVVVPGPASILLLGLGIALGALGRRRSRPESVSSGFRG